MSGEYTYGVERPATINAAGMRSMMEFVGVPRRYATASFKQLDDRGGLRGKVLGAIEEWSGQLVRGEVPEGVGMWLAGKKGVGKTWAAASLAVELARANARWRSWDGKWLLWDDRDGRVPAADAIPVVAWCDWPDYVSHLHSMIRDRNAKDHRTKKYLQAEVLIIDDVAKGGLSPYILNRMYELVSHRYNAMSRTIITCNATPDDLFSEIAASGIDGGQDNGEAMASRFSETTQVMLVVGADRRGR